MRNIILVFVSLIFLSCTNKDGITIFGVSVNDNINIASSKIFHRLKSINIDKKYKSFTITPNHVWYVIKDKNGNYETYHIFSTDHIVDSIYFESTLIKNNNIYLYHNKQRLSNIRVFDITKGTIRTNYSYHNNRIIIKSFKTK